jgi:hypothetical protein
MSHTWGHDMGTSIPCCFVHMWPTTILGEFWVSCGCHFGSWCMSLFTCGATWWSVTFCHCQQGGPTMGNIAHNHELSKLTWMKAWNKEPVVPRLVLSKDYIFHIAIFYWFHYLFIKTKKIQQQDVNNILKFTPNVNLGMVTKW